MQSARAAVRAGALLGRACTAQAARVQAAKHTNYTSFHHINAGCYVSRTGNSVRHFSRSSPVFYADDNKGGKEGEAAETADKNKAEGEEGKGDEADTEADDTAALLAAKDVEIADIKDRYMRTLADMENLRRRHATEMKNSKDFGIQSFSKDLVTVADVLEMAVDNAPKELETEAADAPLTKLFEGMTSTQKMLQKVFSDNGLVSLRPVDEKFDPATMDAQFQVPDPSKEPDTVAVVTRTGYLLNSRVIRPAGVGVVQK